MNGREYLLRVFCSVLATLVLVMGEDAECGKLHPTGAKVITKTGVLPIFKRKSQISPAAAVVEASGTIQFTSSHPIAWALAPGSIGKLVANDSIHATYTAPKSITNQNVLAGCPVYPNDAIFNAPIDKLPVRKDSSMWTSNMGTNSLSFLPSWGLNIADSTTPVSKQSFFYTTGNNGRLFVLPDWPALKREGGTFITPFNSTDHHIVTVRKDTCVFYELYDTFLSGPRTCRDGITRGCTASSGTIYSGLRYALPANGTTDAAGLPLAPLSLHLAEIKASAIHHALRFTVPGGYIRATSGMTYLWPATVGNFSGPGSPRFPPYGARFRLKAAFDTSHFSPVAKTLLTALKQYGMMLADAGIGPAIITFTDVTEDWAVMRAFGEIGKAGIKMTDFEAVDESPLMLRPGSAEISPSNEFVTPSHAATVYATDLDNPKHRIIVPISLRGVAIAMPSPEIALAMGTPAYQLPFWVTGTTNHSVTWSLVSGPGSVTAGGLYSAPSEVSSIRQAVLKATAGADSNAQTFLYVNVVPTQSGAIRINSGGPRFIDPAGHIFWPDIGLETGGYLPTGGDDPQWMTSNPDREVYQSVDLTWGNDIVYSFALPNGNYKVRFMLGQPYNGVGKPGTTYSPKRHLHSPMHLEANGQIGAYNFDLGLATGYKWATPYDVYVPAMVSNNLLTVALRGVAMDNVRNYNPAPQIGGLEIVPDSAPPHLTIDTQQHKTIASGASLHLHAVGWYTSNAVDWSISGPGSIDANGIYTAPETGHASETVTITATSKANPRLTATTALTITGI